MKIRIYTEIPKDLNLKVYNIRLTHGIRLSTGPKAPSRVFNHVPLEDLKTWVQIIDWLSWIDRKSSQRAIALSLKAFAEFRAFDASAGITLKPKCGIGILWASILVKQREIRLSNQFIIPHTEPSPFPNLQSRLRLFQNIHFIHRFDIIATAHHVLLFLILQIAPL